MKVTIDSTEPLEDAIRVLGAMYDVSLVPAHRESADAPPSTDGTGSARSGTARKGRRKRAAARKPTSSTNRAGRSAEPTAAVDTAELRSWARQNGYTVADRGRVPAAITAAYRAAHQG